MSKKKQTVPALERLSSIDEVSAVFVFNPDLKILASDMPEHYSEAAIIQIASRIIKILRMSTALHANIKETVFRFENYNMLIKVFADQYYHMAVFFEREADISLLRQPINLAVLNLEKAVKQIEEKDAASAAQTDLAQAARKAEQSIYRATGEDSNGCLARLSVLANYFLGPCGVEILEYGFREFDLVLPLTNDEDMHKIMNFCSEKMSNPEQKAAFLEASENLIDRLSLEMQNKS